MYATENDIFLPTHDLFIPPHHALHGICCFEGRMILTYKRYRRKRLI